MEFRFQDELHFLQAMLAGSLLVLQDLNRYIIIRFMYFAILFYISTWPTLTILTCFLQLRVLSNETFNMLDKIAEQNLAEIAKRTDEEDDEDVADVVFPHQFLWSDQINDIVVLL